MSCEDYSFSEEERNANLSCAFFIIAALIEFITLLLIKLF